jgi:hypothetical protein
VLSFPRYHHFLPTERLPQDKNDHRIALRSHWLNASVHAAFGLNALIHFRLMALQGCALAASASPPRAAPRRSGAKHFFPPSSGFSGENQSTLPRCSGAGAVPPKAPSALGRLRHFWLPPSVQPAGAGVAFGAACWTHLHPTLAAKCPSAFPCLGSGPKSKGACRSNGWFNYLMPNRQQRGLAFCHRQKGALMVFSFR